MIKDMRFCGKIGYAPEQVETSPGVYEEKIVEHVYRGDVTRNTRRLESDDKVNNSITSNNTISIMADAYAYDHFYDMRYVEWQGAKWKVTNVEVQHPRLILTIGGLYNEHGTSSDASQSSD